jgi:small subunit ribosomal protein S2
MKMPSLSDLLRAGVHFGHQKSKRHPGMTSSIYATRNGVSVIDLEATQKQLEEAAKAAQSLAAQGKTILFIGTKSQAGALVKKFAEACGMPYMHHRWLGGLLTNFKNVVEVPKKLVDLKMKRDNGDLKKYTKKEQLEFDREIERLSTSVEGLQNLTKLPDAVFIVDLKEEKTALTEALQLKIPVFAMCDTNVNPRDITFPIPSNDDAVKSIELILTVMSEAIETGRKDADKKAAADAAAAVKAAAVTQTAA